MAAMKTIGNLEVAREICHRLRDVHIQLDGFVDSDVKGLDSTLKGIEFKCKNLPALQRAFDTATDYLGRRAFYTNGPYGSAEIVKELIRNAPQFLDMSFAATDGFGYREIRDMPMVPSLSPFRGVRPSADFNSRFGFEDEQEYHFDITSLHAALTEPSDYPKKKCNVHIDNMGFVLRGPGGAFLTPDFPDHGVNELGLKTLAFPDLAGGWVARNVDLHLPNHRNGYRPGLTLSVKPTADLTISVKFTTKCSYCRDNDQDYRMTVPDGWSIGAGLTLRFGRKW